MTNPKDVIGAKKSPLHLLPGTVKVAVSYALGTGAAKYGRYNWRTQKIQSSMYEAAIERHLELYKDGEDLDPETGCHHLAHLIAGASILLDDRWKTGLVALMMKDKDND